ncbi:MAG: T9SS type A sorting domain-containing protein [Ekhidna sp.]
MKSFLLVTLLLCNLTMQAQLSSQGHTTNYAGGTLSSTNYSTEFATGQTSGIPASENFSIYLDLAAFNMESATVSVNTVSGGSTLTEETQALLLRIRDSGNYDTLDNTTNSGGSFDFNPVFVGSYLINVDSDPDQYVATYYGNAFLWEEADVLELSSDTLTEIIIEAVPPTLTEADGDGNVSGVVEENFEDSNGRINARRRAAKRKCGLRRKRTGGRTGQASDEFELIAYGETNENGEFEYGFLPQGTYRFFVEYPGIPIDESSFVQFEVGEAGVTDNSLVLAAVVTETGISIELILGLTSEFFTDFSIYPNPAAHVVNVSYDKMNAESISMQLIDMHGKVLLTREMPKSKGGQTQVDLQPFVKGQYLLKFIDNEKKKTALTFRIIKN